MRIVIFEALVGEMDAFQPLAQQHQLIVISDKLTAETVAGYADAEIISTLNESETTLEVLSRLPALKYIASRTTGLDHLPLDYCSENKIGVGNVPHYGQNTVAEHAFALLLALAHRLPTELPRPGRGDFIPKGPAGFDLQGKTMGVIGTGNIGRHTIRIAQGFGMPVVAHDIQPDAALATKTGFAYVSKAALLAQADIITLHVPGDASTHHLIGKADFAQMRDGAILMNTSRGSVVDVVALTDALHRGKLGGACIDVLPYEPYLRNPERLPEAMLRNDKTAEALRAIQLLCALPNVVMTSHMGYNTTEALARIRQGTLENIEAFINTAG